MSSNADRAPAVVIKQYAVSRFYNTTTASYVTLDDLRRMAGNRIDFVVYDARTCQDITRMVLTLH
jgi:polyhydroxyalkanoate synthesis regulator protein